MSIHTGLLVIMGFRHTLLDEPGCLFLHQSDWQPEEHVLGCDPGQCTSSKARYAMYAVQRGCDYSDQSSFVVIHEPYCAGNSSPCASQTVATPLMRYRGIEEGDARLFSDDILCFVAVGGS